MEVNHDFVLSNSDIDDFISDLQNWQVIFQKYPLNASN